MQTENVKDFLLAYPEYLTPIGHLRRSLAVRLKAWQCDKHDKYIVEFTKGLSDRDCLRIMADKKEFRTLAVSIKLNLP